MFKGVVQRINSNPWQGKMLHSFTLNSERGFFNLGRIAPSFKEGQTIEFEASPAKRAGNFDVDVKSIVVIGEDAVKPESYSMVGAKRTSLLQKDDYWNRKEERDIENQKIIQLQSARNTAIAYMELANKVAPYESLTELDEAFETLVGKFLEANASA